MNINIVFDHKASMPESINVWKFIPIWRVSIVNIERNRLSYLIVSPSNNKEKSSNKNTSMLISFCRFWIISIWRLHPIKSSISMFRKPQVSFRGVPSDPRPPKITIIPLAVPVRQILAAWYTLAGGFYNPVWTFSQIQLPRTSIFHTSPTAYEPVFPP